jgi:hypothetical protein
MNTQEGCAMIPTIVMIDNIIVIKHQAKKLCNPKEIETMMILDMEDLLLNAIMREMEV